MSRPIVSIGTTANISGYQTYASDGAFVAGKGSAAANGDVYYNTTDNAVKGYVNSAWVYLISSSGTAISTLTAETSPAADDHLIIGDTSGSDVNKMTFENFFKVVGSITEDTAPDITLDYIPTYDASASAAKRVLAYLLKYDSVIATAKTADYTFAATDDLIKVNATGGAFTVTLPTAVGRSGKRFYTYQTTTTPNQVSFATTSSQTINGAAASTYKSATINEVWGFESDGSNWLVIEHLIDSSPVSFTPTGSWVTNTTYTGNWRREGRYMVVNVHIALAGAPTSATLTVNLPTSYTIDTAYLLSTGTDAMLEGTARLLDTGVADSVAQPRYSSTSAIKLIRYDGSAISEASPWTWGNTDLISINVKVPITGWNG